MHGVQTKIWFLLNGVISNIGKIDRTRMGKSQFRLLPTCIRRGGLLFDDKSLHSVSGRRKEPMTRALVTLATIGSLLTCALSFSQEKAGESTQGKDASILKVADSKLGTAVEDRQIVGEGTHFVVGQKVYLWLELQGGPADSITVTWKHGEKSYQTALKVGGPTYHTWAYKTVAMAGDWTVSVTDAAGNELKQLSFTVGEAGGK
jgi:hypothetical protein